MSIPGVGFRDHARRGFARIHALGVQQLECLCRQLHGIIRIIEHEKLVETVGGDTGPYFQSRLGELADHPLVGEVRGVGFIAGIELVEDKPSRRRFDPAGKVGSICRDLCLEHGLIARAVGDVMTLSPPLIMTRGEIDEMVSILGKCLDLTARELNR